MVCKKYILVAALVLSAGWISAQADTVSIGELALWSGGSISTGNNVVISGMSASKSGISLNKGSTSESLYTMGNVWLGNDVTVNGDAIANGSISISKSAEVTGLSKAYSNFVLPAFNLLSAPVTGTSSIYTAAYSDKTLSPGEYSSWSLGSSTTVNLSSGSYNLSSFWAGSGSVINVDTTAGDVVLNVAGDFSAGKGVKFVRSGSGNLRVNVYKSEVWLDNNVNIRGDIRVYGGGVSTGSSVSLTGSIYATGNVYLGNGTGMSYGSGIHTSAIPEPSSLVILAALSMTFIVRRRGSRCTSTAE